MSLSHLLAVSRAFGTIRDAPSRFKMVEENLLPKFGQPKPVETVLGQAEARIPASAIAIEMKTDILEPSQRNGSSLSPRQNSPGLFSYFSGTWALLRNAFGAPIANRLKSFRNLFGFKSPFQSKSVRPPRSKGPVQAELVLDMVKPVCNDLTDTDLELIPAPKSLARNQPSPTLITAGRAVPSAPQVGRAVPSTPEFGPAIQTQPFGAAPVGKTDLVGAWWGRLRTGLLRFRSGQT